MERLLLIACLLLTSCTTALADARDAAAIGLALATMMEPGPTKCTRCNDTGVITHGDGHQTPCPDCQDGAKPAGPIDTLREMSALVKKGNALADRSKALFDAAQGDGLDMKLQIGTPRLLRVPVEAVVLPRVAQDSCVGGVCKMPAARPSTAVQWMPTRRRVLWRFPRLRWRR